MKVKESGQFETAPPGSHIARCYGLVDMGTQSHTFQGTTHLQRDVRIMFELPCELMTGEFNPEVKGKPFMVSMTCKQSLHPKARLRERLKGWRGRDFTKEELTGFELRNILGKPCRLTLVASPDGQFTNVEAISPLGKGDKCPKQVNHSIYVSLDAEEFKPEMLDIVGERTREKICGSPEYQALVGDSPQDGPPEPDGDKEQGDDNQPF